MRDIEALLLLAKDTARLSYKKLAKLQKKNTVQYEYSKYNVFYYTTFGPFVLLTKTIIEPHENDKSKTTSNFSIGSMGVFKIFHPLIIKNYM